MLFENPLLTMIKHRLNSFCWFCEAVWSRVYSLYPNPQTWWFDKVGLHALLLGNLSMRPLACSIFLSLLLPTAPKNTSHPPEIHQNPSYPPGLSQNTTQTLEFSQRTLPTPFPTPTPYPCPLQDQAFFGYDIECIHNIPSWPDCGKIVHNILYKPRCGWIQNYLASTT